MQSYADNKDHPPDFLVDYSLIPATEGGRKVTFQHLRCDFHYAGDDLEEVGLYMIYPEFLNADGQPIDDEIPIPLEGTASMWILVPESRSRVHRERIQVGTTGFFMEGSRKIGSVTVTELVGLHSNPDR